MTCPSCGAGLPDAAGALIICPSCLRSVVVTDDGIRLATAVDTVTLSDTALALLRKQRTALRKAKG